VSDSNFNTNDIKSKMKKAVEHTQNQLAHIRTSRASETFVEKLNIDYYGNPTPLRQLATFSIPEARVLVIHPYDKNALSAIEKAILESDLGITPNTDGSVIRLNFPALTEERRKELIKLAHGEAERGRISVRNIRRNIRHDLEQKQKNSEISKEELGRFEKDLEKITHEFVEQIDSILAAKEKELKEI
jgi:ribosome recycling factor